MSKITRRGFLAAVGLSPLLKCAKPDDARGGVPVPPAFETTDDVRIYDTTKTAAEIHSLYTGIDDTTQCAWG